MVMGVAPARIDRIYPNCLIVSIARCLSLPLQRGNANAACDAVELLFKIGNPSAKK